MRLENTGGGKVYAQGTLSGLTTSWQRFSLTLTSNATDAKGHMDIVFSKPGTVWLDVVSLFPRQTFNGRANGMRHGFQLRATANTTDCRSTTGNTTWSDYTSHDGQQFVRRAMCLAEPTRLDGTAFFLYFDGK